MNRVEGWQRARIGLLYAFMYVGGPLLWGGWMVYRLRLLAPEEYVRCLLSPFTLSMLAAFLAGNLAGIHRAAGARARADEGSLRRTLWTHCASLVLFGTAGTFLFLVPLSGWPPAVQPPNGGGWLARAGIGALSGASLVFLTYGFLTVAVFRLLPGGTETLQGLRRFCSTLFPLGVVLFVAAAALAGLLQGLTVWSGVSLALPLATTSFLFIRTMRRTGAARRGATHDAA